MENKFTLEMLEKFKEAIGAAKSADEILTLAKESGVELSAEKAEELFATIHSSKEVSDEELDNVVGGIARNTTVPADKLKDTYVSHN